MANIGEPVRRHTVIPLTEPITAPEGPVRVTPCFPERSPTSPVNPAGPSWTIPSTPTVPTIPYAGVRTGELIGHRLWWVLPGAGELWLSSFAHRRLWYPDETVSGNLDEVVLAKYA